MSDPILAKLVDKLSNTPDLLAYPLNQYRTSQGLTWDELSAKFGLTQDQIGKLALCRLPRRDADDMDTIARAVGIEPETLVGILNAIQGYASPISNETIDDEDDDVLVWCDKCDRDSPDDMRGFTCEWVECNYFRWKCPDCDYEEVLEDTGTPNPCEDEDEDEDL